MENKNLTFEQANELLEKTVSKMESGELTLEQTMEEYAKACELLAYCMKQLEQCKCLLKVKFLFSIGFLPLYLHIQAVFAYGDLHRFG